MVDFFIKGAIYAIMLAVMALYYSSACTKQYSSYGEISWGPVQGCMVKINGRNVPANNIREVPSGVTAK